MVARQAPIAGGSEASEARGRTALVLASTGGLGLACARALAASEVRVAVTGRRGEVAKSLASELPGAIGIGVDISDPSALDEAISEACLQFGHIDCIVLNSGGPPPGRASDVSVADLGGAMDAILYPAQRAIRRVLPEMTARGWGRIVAIGSSGVEQPIPGLAASNAARSALAALLKTLAGEVARNGVTVNMVIPGRYATERVKALDRTRATEQRISEEEVARRSQATIPAARYGDPSELGALVAFLCSPEASYITGTLIRADGGLVACTG